MSDKKGKPDYLDFDGDGDKEESMKSALATKKGLKSGDSTFLERRKKLAGLKDAAKATVKAKDGARTKVRGTGAAKKGFRKARMS
jgi:hypothetical protein